MQTKIKDTYMIDISMLFHPSLFEFPELFVSEAAM
jgi:hypothetical protein